MSSTILNKGIEGMNNKELIEFLSKLPDDAEVKLGQWNEEMTETPFDIEYSSDKNKIVFHWSD